MITLNNACLMLLWLNCQPFDDTRVYHEWPIFLQDKNIVQVENRTDPAEKHDKTKFFSSNNIFTFNIANLINNVKAKNSTNLKNAKNLEEIYCLALNIYFEARGESELGQKAVGHVVMNRVGDAKFPNSICRVVKQGGERKLNRCQFSWWCDGRSDRPTNLASWYKSFRIAHEIYSGKSTDPTQGALWYHAEYVNPYWKKALRRGPKIGRHIFYKNAPRYSKVARNNTKLDNT
ncbi:cell wall hydrolase [Methylomarinum vadi]|uniref:cell wall hydrolase n=1 Tax=Methylomarinum vadi TaxID=438855 RepID=UPI000689C1E9|nr:cell wall hydrolase [Methylomarinum vadi]